jgi:hypothetical protein
MVNVDELNSNKVMDTSFLFNKHENGYAQNEKNSFIEGCSCNSKWLSRSICVSKFFYDQIE